MEALIREAQTEDFEGVFALVLELREHFEDHKLVDKEGLLAIYERFLEHDDRYVYVAETGGSIIGLMSLTIGASLYDHKPYVVIDELVVNAAHRGQGVGKRLVDEAFSRAVERGCGEVCVDTTTSNEGALRFYREHGFDHESVMFEKELE